MEQSAMNLGQFVFRQIWGYFGIKVPGFNFTFAQMLFGIAICSVSLIILRVFFGIGGRGVMYRVASSRKPKISENRKRDEY